MPDEHPTRQQYQCARCGHRWMRTSKPTRCGNYSCRTTQWETNEGRKLESHGHGGRTRSPTYDTWAGMIDRCVNPNNKRFARYGGRGITVCERWRNSFSAFLQDMGERPEGKSIDRINNDGNYEPGNCRWATRKEQQNNLHNNLVIEFNGVRRTIHEWADVTGIKTNTLRRRLASQWPLEQVFGMPLMQGVRRKERERMIS